MSRPSTAKTAILESPESEVRELGSVAPLSPHDEARVVAMLKQCHTVVWRTAYRMGLNAAQADDATQQAFITASRRIADIQPGCERGFLLGAVVRAAKNQRRLAARRYEMSDAVELEEAPDRALSPHQLVELKQARVLLDRVLDGLPEATREAFVLFELEGLPLKEIRDLLDIPMGTLASRLRRAREKFQKEVEALHRSGGVR
jgi:RNA polymerase sigma-70 factor (ECF subfamily)